MFGTVFKFDENKDDVMLFPKLDRFYPEKKVTDHFKCHQETVPSAVSIVVFKLSVFCWFSFLSGEQ